MRCLPALIFSPSSSSSSSSDPNNTTPGTWFFGNGKKSTRSKKLRHVDDVHSVVVSPTSFSRSPSARTNPSSVAPQPLPLQELSRNKDAFGRTLQPNVPVVDTSLPTGFKMRCVFASQVQETRRNTEQNVETRSPVSPILCQDTSVAATPSNRGNDFWICVSTRSAPSSPFASPKLSTKTDDFLPYYYVQPKVNQFWSAPEMPISTGQLPPAFFDSSALVGTDSATSSGARISPRQQNPKSPTRPSSPIPRLSLDTSTMATAPLLTVHPLPLPPWPGTSFPSPSSTCSQPGPKMEPMSMKNQWQKGKLIGRGTFGSVYVATNRKTGALCAMKEAGIFSDDPKSAENIKQLEQEIKVLSQLKHPNIVQYFGSEIVEDKFYIYLEYVHPGSINKYVREHCGAITESVVRNFTRHILSGLAYLHSKKTIHRDIKGDNLLVDSSGVVKLADFGMAKHLISSVTQKDNSSGLAFAIDIWSLGCTIIEMFTGKPPWSEYEGAAAMFKVMKDTPPIPETLSSEGKDFLRLCFKRNPAERPTGQYY